MGNWWENFLFTMWTRWNETVYRLNTPDMGLRCPHKCNGRLVAFKRSNRGLHFRCVGCFKEWVKPPRGDLYRETTIVKRIKGYRKLARS